MHTPGLLVTSGPWLAGRIVGVLGLRHVAAVGSQPELQADDEQVCRCGGEPDEQPGGRPVRNLGHDRHQQDARPDRRQMETPQTRISPRIPGASTPLMPPYANAATAAKPVTAPASSNNASSAEGSPWA